MISANRLIVFVFEGMYCAEPGLASPSGSCDPGYFCGSGSTVASPHSSDPVHVSYTGETCVSTKNGTLNDICPPGHYCEAGSASPSACPPGTNTSAVGLANKDQCQLCTKGYYCPLSGTVLATRRCPSGYYCPSGTANPTSDSSLLCPEGSACPEGSWTPTPCGLGEYQDTPGQDTCKQCPAGYMCNDVTGTVTPVICRAGTSCMPGSSSESPCPLGKYQGDAGQSECKSCPSGYYCDDLNGIGVPKPCKIGSYCPEGTGSSLGQLCPPGRFSNKTGISSMLDCKQCLPGNYFFISMFFCASVIKYNLN